MVLPETYIVSKFYQYAGYPKYNRISKVYYGCCPSCREGNSWGKKRRLYFVPKDNIIYCHNCGISLRPIKWIQQVSNLSYGEIMTEIKDYSEQDTQIKDTNLKKKDIEIPPLPRDSINLSDQQQLEYHRDNFVVQGALKLLNDRRLLASINKPKAFWLSLTDPVHKNRLIIPFEDLNGKIVHYQSRTIIEDKKKKLPKYLSKQNSDKTLFGIERVDSNNNYIFITEGPLDACFIKNGVAVAGITEGKGEIFTDKQKVQLQQYPLHKLIYVLDNQRVDAASKKKSNYLIKQGCSVFVWPEKLKKFKDINELCSYFMINEISNKFIIDNTHSGVKARVLLTAN